jgi:ribosomal-protein-alanine N-acetyltransferase
MKGSFVAALVAVTSRAREDAGEGHEEAEWSRICYEKGMKRSAERAGRGRGAVVTGERVFLRYPTARDEAEVLALKRGSRKHLARWEASPVGGGDMFGRWWFKRFLKSSKTERSHRFVVCLKESGEIVGQLGLGDISRGAFQSCFLGYWIGAAYVRRGLMTEAVRLAARYAFRNLKLHRVEANIVPRNRASKGLARKVGFRYEGTAKRYLKIAGAWEDHEHWAMTVEDWRLIARQHSRGRC